ncbi:hypothetical protein MASR2M70_14360 [Bacillota bacterium]
MCMTSYSINAHEPGGHPEIRPTLFMMTMQDYKQSTDYGDCLLS